MSLPPVVYRLGALSLDELRTLRAQAESTTAIAVRAGVSSRHVANVLRFLGLAYPQGGARANSGPKPRRRCAALDGAW